MIYYNNKPIIGVYIQNIPIIKIYLAQLLVWELNSNKEDSLSCFGSGYWKDEYPWTDNIPWKD